MPTMVGIVSATHRIWGKAIQTDAKISPANYGGPLVDIRGRVLGVLVPLSPQPHAARGETSEVAGAEWYDSGIGFAVPLDEILPRLPAMREGKDQHPGLLGVSLKTGDIYSLPAEIAASQAGSPAYKAGLRAGDTIVEIGPKQVLSGLIKRITPDARPISLTDAEVVKLLTTVGTTEPV